MLNKKKESFKNEKDYEYFENIELGTSIHDIKDLNTWKLQYMEKFDDATRYSFYVEKEKTVGTITVRNTFVESVYANEKPWSDESSDDMDIDVGGDV